MVVRVEARGENVEGRKCECDVDHIVGVNLVLKN